LDGCNATIQVDSHLKNQLNIFYRLEKSHQLYLRVFCNECPLWNVPSCYKHILHEDTIYRGHHNTKTHFTWDTHYKNTKAQFIEDTVYTVWKSPGWWTDGWKKNLIKLWNIRFFSYPNSLVLCGHSG